MTGPGPAVESLVRRLSQRGETLAVVESVTGGLLAATVVEVAGVSAVFRGGLIVYATDLKATLAGVSADLLADRGPVDPDVALALARGGRLRCGADWCLATTGEAGPVPAPGPGGAAAAPVGTVYVAIAGPDDQPAGPGGESADPAEPGAGAGGATARHRRGAGPAVRRWVFDGDRAAVRHAAVRAALDLLGERLTKL